MASSLSTKFQYRNARDLVRAVTASGSSFYMFYGRTKPWADEATPPTPDNSIKAEYDAWHDMTALKKIDGQDVRLGFRRIDWTTSTVYYEYREDVDLTDKDFYIYTDEKKVYKCISNNNGAASTIKPTHTDNSITKQADGYKWKYMFTLSDSLIRKFFVPGYLPIDENETVVNNAVKGAIENIRINTSGSGYTASTTLPVFIAGDGNENSSATATLTVDGGTIVGITVANGGSNYPYAPESNIPVAIRQVGNNGAVETAFCLANTDENGAVSSITLVLGGSGYTSGTASIVQSSCQAEATTNGSGEVTDVSISTGKQGQNFRSSTPDQPQAQQ